MRDKLIIAFVYLVVFVSCKKENMCDCVKSTGETNIIYHTAKGFNCIELKDKMDLYITQGPYFEIKVEAGANLQRLIKTELEGETLKVFNANKCNWVRGYKHKIKVYITAPYFKKLLNMGIGNIESTNVIAQDTLTCKTKNSGEIHLNLNTSAVISSANGNGDIYLSGTTQNLVHDCNSTNYLYAADLAVANYIYLHTATIGKAFVNAPENGLMDIIIDRSGDVYYKGNPSTIHLTRNGKGNLIKE